ncbi:MULTISPECIES: AlpA family phage regulatory protein [Burkholderia]|uniref:AlpA family phage regulatory protein n=1 Tax=Burkholderia TaxID=32008 RepID=UPI00158B4C55|nr:MULTISPECIES: AlpA family phage regulatory protein [Burkholderia]
MANQIKSALTIIRRRQVEEATGLSRSQLYLRMKSKTFPQSVRLSVRSVGWRLQDIEDFLVDPANYRVSEDV